MNEPIQPAKFVDINIDLNSDKLFQFLDDSLKMSNQNIRNYLELSIPLDYLNSILMEHFQTIGETIPYFLSESEFFDWVITNNFKIDINHDDYNFSMFINIRKDNVNYETQIAEYRHKLYEYKEWKKTEKEKEKAKRFLDGQIYAEQMKQMRTTDINIIYAFSKEMDFEYSKEELLNNPQQYNMVVKCYNKIKNPTSPIQERIPKPK